MVIAPIDIVSLPTIKEQMLESLAGGGTTLTVRRLSQTSAMQLVK